MTTLPTMTLEELATCRGTNPGDRLYVGLSGKVYDVSKSVTHYGPGGVYHVFAGRDATRALAIESLDPKDAVGDVTGLTAVQEIMLDDWIETFDGKYPVVATLASATQA